MTDINFDFKGGEVILIDKPLHWTSFDIVKKLKFRLPKKLKIGHAGTLDPLATGLLILCTGKKTKSIESYQAQIKEYTGCITVGHTTPSSDLETEFDQKFDTEHINEALIEEARLSFIGEIEQVPPIFSAVKVNGARAYDKARAGETVEIKSRTITIKEFEITKIELPAIYFRIVCSKGTYIRSIARDFGERLQSGAHLSELRRTRIGDFHVDNAYQIENFTEILEEYKRSQAEE